jgi:hypothetical protein
MFGSPALPDESAATGAASQFTFAAGLPSGSPGSASMSPLEESAMI